jgi:hypothetical protein
MALARDLVKALVLTEVTRAVTLVLVAVVSPPELPAQVKASGTASVAHPSNDVPVVLGQPPSRSHLALPALQDKVLTSA